MTAPPAAIIGRMKKLIVVLGGLFIAGSLAFLVLPSRWLGPAISKPAVSTSEPWTRGPVFEVRIERPRRARPLFGTLPKALEAHLLDEAESFDHLSPNAELRQAGPDHLEATATGWRFVLEVDDQGKVASASHLVFPFGVGGRRVSLRCQPAGTPVGYLRAYLRPDSEKLDGTFRLELARCENAASGRSVDWPPSPPFGLSGAPLTVRGSFAGVTHLWPVLESQRPEDESDPAQLPMSVSTSIHPYQSLCLTIADTLLAHHAG